MKRLTVVSLALCAAMALCGCASFGRFVYDVIKKANETPVPQVTPTPTPEPTVAATPSPTAVPTPEPGPVPVPLALTVTVKELGGGAIVSWAPVAGAQYVVLRAAAVGEEAELVRGWGATTFDDGAPAPLPGRFCYRVAAVIGARQGLPSASACADIVAAHPPYVKPASAKLSVLQYFNPSPGKTNPKWKGELRATSAAMIRASYYGPDGALLSVDQIPGEFTCKAQWSFRLVGGAANDVAILECGAGKGVTNCARICNSSDNIGTAHSFNGPRGLGTGWFGTGPHAKGSSIRVCHRLPGAIDQDVCQTYPFVDDPGEIPGGVHWPPKNVNRAACK